MTMEHHGRLQLGLGVLTTFVYIVTELHVSFSLDRVPGGNYAPMA